MSRLLRLLSLVQGFLAQIVALIGQFVGLFRQIKNLLAAGKSR
jgi:hypothetical protein